MGQTLQNTEMNNMNLCIDIKTAPNQLGVFGNLYLLVSKCTPV